MELSDNLALHLLREQLVFDDSHFNQCLLFENSLGERIGYALGTCGLALPAVWIWWTRNKRNDYDMTCEWERLKKEFKEKNGREEMQRLEKLAAPIRLYQGSIAEVERDLNMRLKRIDTQTPETFLKEYEAFDLRVKAAQLGANAVVHYRVQKMEVGYDCDDDFHLGTPVKFAGALYRSQYDIIVEDTAPPQ